MRRWFGALLLAGAGLVLWTATGQARVAFIPPPPPAVQVGQAEVIFVGRVLGHEPMDIDVPVAPKAKETIKIRVAVVKVVDPILGAKEMKSIRVGFNPPGDNPGVRPGRVFPGQNPPLEIGFNGLFVLTRHAGAKDLYIADGPYTIRAIGEDAANSPDVKAYKALAKLLDDPMASLKSKDADERMQIATMLVHRYRTFRGPGQPKEEAIPAAESKLILNAILEGNWNAQPGRLGGQQGPLQLFLQLGVSEKDGWQPKNDPLDKAAQEWLRKNADSYRIKRFVAAPALQQGASRQGAVRIDLIRV